MPSPKLLTLETWAAETYGQYAPCMNTLRRWARESLIYPAPVKHGRSYFVKPDAEYKPFASRGPRLVDRVKAAQAGSGTRRRADPGP